MESISPSTGESRTSESVNVPQVVPMDAAVIAALHPHAGGTSAIQVTQAQHRIQLIVDHWGVKEGENVLEIGCGQGDSTTVFAVAVGEKGHVTAVDPASLDYGSPFTLGQAQAHLKQTSLGPRMTFIQADPVDHLHDLSPQISKSTYSSAALVQMSYYLPSPDSLEQILKALAPHTSRVLFAEYSLTTSPRNDDRDGRSHILATFAQATLAAHTPPAELTANIRTVLSPSAIKASAAKAGWIVQSERIVQTPAGYQDGRWETEHVLSAEFTADVNKYVKDDRVRSVIQAMIDSTRQAKEAVIREGKKIGSMDVWSAILVRP